MPAKLAPNLFVFFFLFFFFNFIVLYPYTPQREDELELFEGTEIEIISTADPYWYQGRYDGRIGLVPSNYLLHSEDVEIGTVMPHAIF